VALAARRTLPNLDAGGVDSKMTSVRMSGAPSAKKKQDFNASLNGYRGFCALLVFGFHMGSAGVITLPQGTMLKDAAAELWISLAYGVEMFFMISGFVILGSLLRHATLRGFLQDRFIRIYSAWVPALVAVTIVCVMMNMKMFADASFGKAVGIFVSNLLLLPPLLPLPVVHQGSWSLSYEWVFYLLAVTGAWLVRRKGAPPVAVGLWGLACGLFVCLYPRSLFFLTGVTVFAGQAWFARHRRWLKWPLVSLLVFLVAWRLTGADKSNLSETLFTWMLSGRWLAAVVAFAASLHLFASVTLNASRQFAFLQSRAFQFLGTISYSFYLWHALVMSATKRVALSYVVPRFGTPAGFVLFVLSSLAIGLLVSWASWSIFEVRFARVLRRGMAAKPTVSSAVPAVVPVSGGLRFLWVSRYMPYPLDAGAKVYSAKLAESLAASGAQVRYLGFGDATAAPASAVEWCSVPGSKRGRLFALFSSLPLAAAIDSTPAYRQLLDEQLKERWDAIILDGYGTGWALTRCLAHRNEQRVNPTMLVHVSHNHEAPLWRNMAEEFRGAHFKRLALRSNANKIATLERRIVREVDLVTTITAEDRGSLAPQLDDNHALVLTPGYDGWVSRAPPIDARTPRRVIIMGSFQWVVKQENLLRFVDVADPLFQQHGIELHILGEVPEELLLRLRARCKATHFHGFVTEVAPHFERARMGVVPESIGGGFKLKFLDYIFGRLPVATVAQAAAGLPDDIRGCLLAGENLEQLARLIVEHVDAVDELNRMQQVAFDLAQERYQWSTRGERLKEAIVAAKLQKARGVVNNEGLPASARVDLVAS
jgi:polysaccharide biosynthesis protein PslH